MDGSIYLSDLISTGPAEVPRISDDERRDFSERVRMEMARLGFDKANELTERSTILTGQDYRAYINY